MLVDGERVLGESTTIVEHLGAPELVPRRWTRGLWDRVIDGQVMTPMQKIVADSLRPEDARDPYGVEEARGTARAGVRAARAAALRRVARRAVVQLADCAAAPALFYARVVHRWDEAALPRLTDYYSRLTARPSVARVIDEARPYRASSRSRGRTTWPDVG